MRTFIAALLIALPASIPALGQFTLPEMAFDSAPDFLKLPDNLHLGEVAGVATNSKGDIFVYTRTGHATISIGTARPFAHGGSRLFQFDKTGKFTREIGKDSYGFLVAQQVRVDPQDNIWAVDQMSSMIMKFDQEGRVALLLGRKAEAERVPALPLNPQPAAPAAGAGGGRGGAPAAGAEAGRGGGAPAAAAGGAEGGGGRGRGPAGAGQQSDVFNRPTDVAWDAAGNIYVADGLGNSRIAKFDKNGKFVKSWGQTGLAQGQFRALHGIAIDAQGNLYAADAGNRRIQVFDTDGNFKKAYLNVGTPAAICISPGAHQYLYVSNSNPVDDIDTDGEIYKAELDGKLLGKFGRAGKLPKEFSATNSIDCRNPNELLVGEIGNWRVQKITLRP